jgi:hypothetical protein
MPTWKVEETEGVWERRDWGCGDLAHFPPEYIVRRPGHYEHECPGCHKKFSIIVRGVSRK